MIFMFMDKLGKWKASSGREKIKSIVRFVNSIGMLFIGQSLSACCTEEDDNFLKKASIGVSTFGLSMAACDMANKCTDALIDDIFDGYEEGKKMAEAKEKENAGKQE